MSKVKEIADISKEIIQKLDEAIVQTINARIFYEKYKSLLSSYDENMKFLKVKRFSNFVKESRISSLSLN